MVAGCRCVNYASRLIARLWRAFSVACGQSYPASHLAGCGAFLWLCRGLASTLMLMGGGVAWRCGRVEAWGMVAGSIIKFLLCKIIIINRIVIPLGLWVAIGVINNNHGLG